MAYRFLGREPIQARQAQQVKKIFIRRRKNYVQQVPPRWEMPCGENQGGGLGREERRMPHGRQKVSPKDET